MNLSKRLKTIADLVDNNCVLADIGTDHAYIPCYLVMQNKIRKAYACDINEGPLANATLTIKKYGVEDSVYPCLCNGLQGIGNDVDEIIIAGMGFETIQSILENSFEQLRYYKKIIVQSNHDVNQLRKWISDNGFIILEERIVFESFFYQIISFKKGSLNKLTEDECEFGVKLYRDPLYNDFLMNKVDQIDKILSHLPETHEKYLSFSKKKNFILSKMK